MDLSSEDSTDDKTPKKAKRKKCVKKQTKVPKGQATMLQIFKKANTAKAPPPLQTLTKKKKRKLSEINSDSDSDTAPKKKQKTTQISAKYSSKYAGAVLNKALISALWELSMIERNSGNKFKANAYSKACKALKEYGAKVKSGKEAQKLNGVGKKIAAKIDEIL